MPIGQFTIGQYEVVKARRDEAADLSLDMMGILFYDIIESFK